MPRLERSNRVECRHARDDPLTDLPESRWLAANLPPTSTVSPSLSQLESSPRGVETAFMGC